MLGAHQGTYDSVFRHPISRNLQWRDLKAMLASLADMNEEPNGNVKFARNGQTLTVRPPRRKDFSDVAALMDIRQFLERTGAPSQEAVADGAHLLVVIDHREARVYRAELHGSVPQRVVPYDPGGFGRHLHYVQEDGDGRRKPERGSFYESVAQALRGAERILVFGSGTGASSAMDQLLAALKRDHPELARRVAGSLVVDAHHLTADQLLATAREFYAGAGA
jgi:hypothetical protein